MKIGEPTSPTEPQVPEGENEDEKIKKLEEEIKRENIEKGKVELLKKTLEGTENFIKQCEETKELLDKDKKNEIEKIIEESKNLIESLKAEIEIAKGEERETEE